MKLGFTDDENMRIDVRENMDDYTLRLVRSWDVEGRMAVEYAERGVFTAIVVTALAAALRSPEWAKSMVGLLVQAGADAQCVLGRDVDLMLAENPVSLVHEARS